MRYGDEFKERMAAQVTGPGAVSAHGLSKECEVSPSVLSASLRDTKVPLMGAQFGLKRGKRWTPEEKLRVLGATRGSRTTSSRRQNAGRLWR
jgi:transposase-like protein